MDLVPSSKCYHRWRELRAAKIHCCEACGFCLLYGEAAELPSTQDIYASVQKQPLADDTFTLQWSHADGQRYRYQPLEHSLDFRILALEPGNFGDALYGELEIRNMQQYPLYDAVSYTWATQDGTDTLSSRLWCRSSRTYINITANCATALQRLRDPNKVRHIWVDTICIDQSNVKERNHQVKNLILTFRSAQQVVVFLGEGDESAYRLVNYMSAADCEGAIPDVTSFIRLFQQRWFHRVWVLQEIAVAKTITVVFGPHVLKWDVMIRNIQSSQSILRARYSGQAIPLPPVLSYALATAETSGSALMSSSASKLDLLSILQVSRSCSCKDARDKVYAILGLVDKSTAVSLDVDYSPTRDVAAVYTELATSNIKSSQSLKILSYVHGNSDLSIPSWVPDWTLPALPLLPRIHSHAENTHQVVSKIPIEGLVQSAGSSSFMEDRSTSLELRVFGRWLGNVFPEGSLELFSGSSAGWLRDHWVSRPSSNIRTRICPERLHFWKTIVPSLGKPESFSNLLYSTPDIPPSFGGVCSNCHFFDEYQGKLGTLRPYKELRLEQVSEILSTGNYQLACFCSQSTYARRIEDELKKPEPAQPCKWDIWEESDERERPRSHYYRLELNDFEEKLYQNRRGRALFATEYTLGIGPENVQLEDEVWFLDGAEVPVVLRPNDKGTSYTVVGECYLHAGLRKSDTCAKCGAETVRSPVKEGLDPGAEKVEISIR